MRRKQILVAFIFLFGIFQIFLYTPYCLVAATSIEAGDGHTVALKSDGTLWAWGWNYNGQLGDGTTEEVRYTPVQVGSATNWAAVAAGYWHTIALQLDGTLWAWGYNNNGQLGTGDNTDRCSPVQIGSDTDWVAVAAGDWHTVALKSDGTLWAWGWNGAYQLGTGDNTDRYSPVQIGSDTNWAAVAAGQYHTVSLKANGTFWAWGNNDYGQLGLGDGMPEQHAPVQVGSDTDWTAVAAGKYHTVSLKANGTFWAWGNNGYGQLGLGDEMPDQHAPVQVGSATNWVVMAVGDLHTVALESDGTLWAWGKNYYGQVGNGNTADCYAPVQVGSDTDWSSGNQSPPNPPTNPSPSSGATGVSVTDDLSWSNGGGAASYKVYFGTDSTPDSSDYRNTQTATTYDPGTLSYTTTYYWRIDAVNISATTTGSVWSFTTGAPPPPPNPPTNPSPTNGATGVSVTADLSWSNGGNAASYNVYLGTTPSLESGDYQGNQTVTTYEPGTLSYATTYYWRIDAVNSTATTTGSVWSFTTGAPPPPPNPPTNPSPSNGATGVSVTDDLSWSNGGDAASYNVYFGTTPSLESGEYQGNQTVTTYDPGTLSYATTYYWRIDAVNSTATTTGNVWSFTTPMDTDGDGFYDNEDAFPNDPTEWVDTDNDGTGNNSDPDDDDDGMPDVWEAQYGLNGLSNDAYQDKDNDGYSNIAEYRAGTNPTDPESHPIRPKAMPWIPLLLDD